MNQPQTWAQELRAVIAATDEAARLLGALQAWTRDAVVAKDVWPRELPEPPRSLFAALQARLDEARQSASAAFHRYSSDPVERLFMKQPLSREEYFLLQAMGATERELPSPPPSDEPPSGFVPPAS